MGEADPEQVPATVPCDVALCIDPDVYARLRPILRHLCVGMIDHNAAVRVVTPTPDVGALTIGPIRMVTYERPYWPARAIPASRRRRFRSLLAGLGQRPPSLVHAVSAGSYEVGEYISAALDIDLIVQLTSFHDIDALTPPLLERTSCFIASSYPIRERLEERIGLPADRVRLIRPGTLAGVRPTCFSRPDRLPTMLCTSPLRPSCGVDQLLQAAKILRDHDWAILTFLTGTGPLEAELRRQAKALDLTSSVIFARPTGNIESIMVGADIYVQPGVETALTMGPIHAMANGMAVIAVDGGVNDPFVDGLNAVVVPDSDATRLTNAIEGLLNDRAYATELARGAISHAKNHYAISGMVERTMDSYQTLLLRQRTFPMVK